jgi:N-formylglutamate deformylase
LGDGQGKTASPELSRVALEAITASPYTVSLNKPFQGGYLTRKFGRPETGVHALQLEMSQAVYMNEAYREIDPEKAKKIHPVLRECLSRLAHALPGLK